MEGLKLQLYDTRRESEWIAPHIFTQAIEAHRICHRYSVFYIQIRTWLGMPFRLHAPGELPDVSLVFAQYFWMSLISSYVER
jgi:hypothetical protein